MNARGSVASPAVMYVQYTNPAGYPPIVHGARLLAEAGASVRLLGISLLRDVTFTRHERIAVELLPAEAGGWRQKIAFLRFVRDVLVRVARSRPDWIYASDPLSTPAVWLASRFWRVRCVYHEHDAPEGAAAGLSARMVAFCRRRIARSAERCVVPSHGRAEALAASTGRRDALVIWNTPRLCEVAPARAVSAGTRLLFHGSIVPARVPETLLHAMAALPSAVTLCVTGYDPTGSGYVARLESLARELGIEGRVSFTGTIETRAELMVHCAQFDVGVSLLPLASPSLNERTMLGASNKPFDYLAGGLALLVPDLPDWRRCFVEPGYGLACDPSSVEDLTMVIRSLHDDPAARTQMGERGRQRVLAEWNYERGFRPVLERIVAPRIGDHASVP